MATIPVTYIEEKRCERINGQLVPRPMSGDTHSDIQENIRRLLSIQAKHHGMKARQEWSIIQSETATSEKPEYLTPDVLVACLPYRRTKAGHLIPPAHLAVEVVSPQQQTQSVFTKAEIYVGWGVEHVWIIDPQTRDCFEYTGGDQFRKAKQELRAGALAVAVESVFALDEG